MGHRILILATVIAVLPIASAANAQAQGRVVGRVIDQTGAVLPGVAIDLVVDKTEMTTTTDGNGHYLFEGVPAGTGELTFRLLDFGVLRRLVSVTHGKTVTSDNVLNLALNADVIVTEVARSATSQMSRTLLRISSASLRQRAKAPSPRSSSKVAR